MSDEADFGRFILRVPIDPSLILVPREDIRLTTNKNGSIFETHDSRKEPHPIPKNLFSGDFMKLDPSDTDALLDFQLTYGMISPVEAGLRFSGGLWGETTWGKLINPLEKVRKAVSDTQEMFKTLNEYRFLLDNKVDREFKLCAQIDADSGSIAAILSKHLGEYFPYVEYQSIGTLKDASGASNKDVRKDTVTLPLMVALEVQMVSALADGETFKRCGNRECPNVFQYKQGAKRGGARFCSEECRNRESYLRSLDAKRPKIPGRKEQGK